MTKDELKRIEIFEETSARFTGDGYQMRDITVSTGAANAAGTLLGIVKRSIKTQGNQRGSHEKADDSRY